MLLNCLSVALKKEPVSLVLLDNFQKGHEKPPASDSISLEKGRKRILSAGVFLSSVSYLSRLVQEILTPLHYILCNPVSVGHFKGSKILLPMMWYFS